jgi:hypothetical protein
MDKSKQLIKNISLNGSLFLAGIVISLFLCEGVLGLLGFPSEVPSRVSHPANYETVRQNIEFQYVFKTNSQGLRYREIPLEKPAVILP